MPQLVKPSKQLTEKPADAVLSEISPDDLIIVQKRQDWRVKVAHVCVDYFEARSPAELAVGNRTVAGVEQLKERLGRISDYVRRDLGSLLVTGVTVHELEALRFKVNYFLEEIVRHLRTSVQSRKKTRSPLEGLSEDNIHDEVFGALDESPDSLCVFVEDVVQLTQFEIEVTFQRERIRLLLGGDRRLSSFGSNETIMTCDVATLWKTVDNFFGVVSYLKENLPPLLDRESPYQPLEDELRTANEQLQMLTEGRMKGFVERCDFKRTQDDVLGKLDGNLGASSRAAGDILEQRLDPMLRQLLTGRRNLVTTKTFKALRDDVVAVVDRLDKLPSAVFLPEPARPELARGEQAQDTEKLNETLEKVLSQMLRLRRTSLWELGDDPAVPEDDARLEAVLREAQKRLREAGEVLDAAAREAHALRGDKLKGLREHFCSMMGELRTFLQTSFAHIAAKDPRSTESSYHFFLREFSEEAQQALVLLREIRELEAFINNLQGFKIANLPLTPENLARILRVLFIDKDDEKKRIPSGEGWRVMSNFLDKLKADLVPRLQKVCALDGIRYEDKNFLTDWAMDLSENCTLCLAQHEIGYSLLQEMGRLRDDGESTLPQSYVHIVITKTCKEMQESLTEVCMTLTASIPYVGIMREGIERRASVFFHRQQKLLEENQQDAAKNAGANVMVPNGFEEFGEETMATIEAAQARMAEDVLADVLEV